MHPLMETPVCPSGDEGLLVAYLHGDNRAHKRLEEHLRRFLARCARQWGVGLAPDQVEEIVQEAWLSIAAHRAELRQSYNPAATTAARFTASFIPNAAQRIRAAYRSYGERSRSRRLPRSDRIVRRSGWEGPKLDYYQLVELTPARNERAEVLDARLDIERLTQIAEPKVAAAIKLVVEEHASLSEAAAAVGLAATTFTRRLSALGRQAA